MSDPRRIVVRTRDCRAGVIACSDDDVIGSSLNGHTVARMPGETLTALLERAERMHAVRGVVPVHLLRYGFDHF